MTSDMVSLATNVTQLIMSDSEPDFAVNYTDVFNPGSIEVTEDNTVKRSEVPMVDYGSMYAHLTCETLGLDCDVYMGSDNEIFKMGAGQIPVTYQPGFGELIMIGAHNNSFFNCLKNVQIGDVFSMETSYGTYTYGVVSTEVVDVSDKDAYDFFTDHEQLLLYTCYPFDMLSHTDYRFMVHADLLSGPTFVD